MCLDHLRHAFNYERIARRLFAEMLFPEFLQ
jgi:hypothetical protein